MSAKSQLFPLLFCDILQQPGYPKSQKGLPFYSFRICEIFQDEYFFLEIRFSKAQHVTYEICVFKDRRFFNVTFF